MIEHLRDPWAVIRRQVEALSDDGTMLICVPNMEHWSFADRLLRGTWKYEPAGLLDDDASALVQPRDDARGPGGGWAWCRTMSRRACSMRRRHRSSPTHDRTGADQRSASIRRSTRSAPRRCNMSGA